MKTHGHSNLTPLADAFLYLATSYNKFLPTMSLLEALLTCAELVDSVEYIEQVYNVVPDSSLYTELVWPAPRHYSAQQSSSTGEHQGFSASH